MRSKELRAWDFAANKGSVARLLAFNMEPLRAFPTASTPPAPDDDAASSSDEALISQII